MLIRDFQKSDIDDFLEVAMDSFVEEFEISGFDPEHIRKMVDKMFSFWGKILFGFLKLIEKDPFSLLVAEVDGRIVGSTMANVRGKIGYIAAVMVHPNHRRKGIATKLLENALNCFQKKKVSRAILHVVTTNTPAIGLYHKFGFEEFESVVHLVGNIWSLQRPQNLRDIQIRNIKKNDLDAVYDLIRHTDEPKHLEIFDFKKKNLKIPLTKRIIHFATDKQIVAIKNDKIIGYIEASYTTAEEAGRIRNMYVHPDMGSKGIEEMLIWAGVNHIKSVGATKIIATTLSTKQEFLEKMKRFGFKESLEMEGMVLEFKN